MVHRLVGEAQTGVESRLRALLERGEGVAGRSLDALRGRDRRPSRPTSRSPPPAPRPPRGAGAERRGAGRKPKK